MRPDRTDFLLSATAALVVFGIYTVVTMLPAGAFAADPRDDMRRIELTLLDHGYRVDGFADTPPPDLALIDELAPKGCAGVMRAAWLARLAIVRKMPERALYASDVARGVAAEVAQDTGRLACLGVEP